MIWWPTEANIQRRVRCEALHWRWWRKFSYVLSQRNGSTPTDHEPTACRTGGALGFLVAGFEERLRSRCGIAASFGRSRADSVQRLMGSEVNRSIQFPGTAISIGVVDATTCCLPGNTRQSNALLRVGARWLVVGRVGHVGRRSSTLLAIRMVCCPPLHCVSRNRTPVTEYSQHRLDGVAGSRNSRPQGRNGKNAKFYWSAIRTWCSVPCDGRL